MFVLTPHRQAHRAAVAPQFNRAVDRLFEQSLSRIFNDTPSPEPTRTPAMDVTETDTAYNVVLDVPGVSREQLTVSVEGRRVSIETSDVVVAPVAEGTAPADIKDTSRVLYRERSSVKFARTVSLPAEVDQAASQAKFENGVLTLTLAKKVPTGATRLTVN